MIIKGLRLIAATHQGNFGFHCAFGRNLNVIRAGNSGGKSTLVKCLLYSLGMEELVGGKGERALPYAVKEYIEHDEVKIAISSSDVLIELESADGKQVTLRRAIKHPVRSTKLIEAYPGGSLSSNLDALSATPLYLHDAGSARVKEGFYKWLEDFLGFDLPQVPTTSGSDTKLYLQTIFAAAAVEQKRGWTDYVANLPFYGIRDARSRVVEYILGLSVFEANSRRSRLNSESVEIDNRWRSLVSELKRDAGALGLTVEVASGPDAKYELSTLRIGRNVDKGLQPIQVYIEVLRAEYAVLTQRAEQVGRVSGSEAMLEIEKARSELESLSVLHERAATALALIRASVREYDELIRQTDDDLEKNKTALKLRKLGAQHEVHLASGHCPTCSQPVEDNLLADATSGPQMDLETNIGYLESQSRMLQRQVAGLKEEAAATEGRVNDLQIRLAAKHDYLTALRGDVSSGATESKAVVRRQVQIELELKSLELLAAKADAVGAELEQLAGTLRANQDARKSLPRQRYSEEDERRLSLFEKFFRANAGSFGYKSAPIAEIEISRDSLVPALSKLELREILGKASRELDSDSSASDFVRLIWSYLLALYQTASHKEAPGHHPGLVVLDEPGQHAMRVESQHALLQQLAGERQLQSFVAASFDELDAVFLEATFNVPHHLLAWEGKLIRPIE